jgi:hypothetical protein
MVRKLQMMRSDLSSPIKLLDKRTNTVIGKCGYLNIEEEIIDVDFSDVSHITDEPIKELPDSIKNQELEEIFEEMFEEMMAEPI